MCLLTPFTVFAYLPLFTSGKPSFSVCIYELSFVHLFLLLLLYNSTYKWDHMVFVFFWLTSLSTGPLRSTHVILNDRISFFFFLFFFGCWAAYRVPGPGIIWTHSCDLCFSCGSARSLTHCAGPGIEPVSLCSRDAANPIMPQQELQNFFLFYGWKIFQCVCIYILI